MSLLLGAAVSAGSALLGGIADAFQKKKQRKKIDGYQKNLDKWYQQQMSTDYLDTKQAKSTISLLNRKNQNDLESLNNDLIKGGYTDESKIGMISNVNEAYADNIVNLSSLETKYRDGITNRYWDATKDLNNKREALGATNIGASMSPVVEKVGDYILGSGLGK